MFSFGAVYWLRALKLKEGAGETDLEKVPNYPCPRCGQPQLNVYYSDKTDSRVGAWCEYCNLKAYFDGEQLVPIGS